jgi:hypothetical protein
MAYDRSSTHVVKDRSDMTVVWMDLGGGG